MVNSTTRRLLEAVAVDAGQSHRRRARAVYLLGLWPDAETVAIIERAHHLLDTRGRQAAAATLARVTSTRAVDALVRLADDSDLDVRRVAINGLARSERPEAAIALQALLANEPSSDLRGRIQNGLRQRKSQL